MRRVARTLAEKVPVRGEVMESTYASTLDAVSPIGGSSFSSQEFATKQEVELPKKQFCANEILSVIQPRLIKEMKVPQLSMHTRLSKLKVLEKSEDSSAKLTNPLLETQLRGRKMLYCQCSKPEYALSLKDPL